MERLNRRRAGLVGLALAFAVLNLPAAQAATVSEPEIFQLIAKAPGGEIGQAPRFDVAQASPPEAPATPSAGAAPKPVAASALKPSDVAGRYSIQRENGKDSGCMLTLDDKAKAPGGNKAGLAPACKDEGMLIFDPVGWRLEGGNLVLTARRGHKAHFDLQPDGTWRKDPKEGKALILKKM